MEISNLLLDDIMAPPTEAPFSLFSPGFESLNCCDPHQVRGRKLQQEGAQLTSVVVEADFLFNCVKVREVVCNQT